MNDRQHDLSLMIAYLRQRPTLVRRCLALGGEAAAILDATARAMADAQYPALRRDPGFLRWCAEREAAADTWDINA